MLLIEAIREQEQGVEVTFSNPLVRVYGGGGNLSEKVLLSSPAVGRGNGLGGSESVAKTHICSVIRRIQRDCSLYNPELRRQCVILTTINVVEK